MKRAYLIIALVAISLTEVYAQHEVGTLTVQPKIGLSVSEFWDYTDEWALKAWNPRYGFAVGAEFEYQLKKKFSLSTGLQYSQQGAKACIKYDDIKEKTKYKMDYINIPILANFYVGKDFTLKCGIQPGFNVNAGYTYSSMGSSVSGDVKDLGIDVRSFDLSIPMGLSYEYKNFVADLRYNMSIINLSRGNSEKNYSCQLLLGYRFNL